MQPGESIRFGVHWGILGKAGEATVRASQAEENEAPLVLSTNARTVGLAGALYHFDAIANLRYEPKSGEFLGAEGTTSTRRQDRKMVIRVDREAGTLSYTDLANQTRNREVKLPEGEILDFISALMAVRQWNLRPGDVREATILFDRELYPITLTAVRVESIRSSLGSQDALLIVPDMPKNPRGIFARGGSIRIWLSEREPKIPVRFEVKLRWGTATGHLESYEPPPN